MRAAVAEIERQRRLRIGSPPRRYAGGGAAERLRSIRADREPRAHLAIGMFDRDPVAVRSNSKCRRRNPWQLDRARRASSTATRCRFSILWPKASSPISAASKKTSGARNKRRVSSTIRSLRSGAACGTHACQTPKHIQRLDRACQQRGGAMVRRYGLRRDQKRIDAGRRDGESGDKSGRPAADHSDVAREYWISAIHRC